MMAKMHKTITRDRIVEAAKRQMETLDNPGFCIACGYEQEGCEPDMRRGECEACGEARVYGAQEILFHLNGV